MMAITINRVGALLIFFTCLHDLVHASFLGRLGSTVSRMYRRVGAKTLTAGVLAGAGTIATAQAQSEQKDVNNNADKNIVADTGSSKEERYLPLYFVDKWAPPMPNAGLSFYRLAQDKNHSSYIASLEIEPHSVRKNQKHYMQCVKGKEQALRDHVNENQHLYQGSGKLHKAFREVDNFCAQAYNSNESFKQPYHLSELVDKGLVSNSMERYIQNRLGSSFKYSVQPKRVMGNVFSNYKSPTDKDLTDVANREPFTTDAFVSEQLANSGLIKNMRCTKKACVLGPLDERS